MTSWETVHELLKKEGPLTPLEITRRTQLAPRTVNFALRKLLRNHIVKKIPNLTDMRSPIYCLVGDGVDKTEANT